MGFPGVDFLKLDELLSDEELQIRDAARAYVDDKILPIIEQHHRAGTFPNELIREMGEMGFLGSNLEGYDCPGINNVAYGLLMQELERGDSGVRSFCSVQGALVMYPIHAFGSEEQKEKWLPALASGEKVGCFGLTEADHGSDPGGMITRAEDKGDHWLLNGGKYWITNGCVSDVAVVWAKTTIADGGKGVRGFIVERDREGFRTETIKNKFSLRASVTSELIFEDVKLPKENMLPKTVGLKNALMCLNNARYGIAWGGVGSMLATYEEALRYAGTRKQFDRPIASFQLVQRKLVEMLSYLTHGQLTALRLGRLKDAGTLHHSMISFGKRNNILGARECAKLGREILGAAGICDDYQAMRHMMNIESVYTYEGTHDIHTLILGHEITGVPAFS